MRIPEHLLFIIFLLPISAYFQEISQNNDNIKSEFENFIQKYKRKYSNEETKQQRFKIFRANYITIQTHNKRNVGWTLGVNEYSDYSINEQREWLFNLKYVEKMGETEKLERNKRINNEIINNERINNARTNNERIMTSSPNLRGNIPQNNLLYDNIIVDWTKAQNVIGKIFNQGKCGVSYAITVAESIQTMLSISKNTPIIPLSAQQIIDCSGEYGNFGCSGGTVLGSLEYAVSVGGLLSMEEYPYVGEMGKCLYVGKGVIGRVDGWKLVPRGDNDGLLGVLRRRPISVSLDASNWAMYFGGIMKECGTNLNHAALLVGAGEENGQKYWKIKNSWGEFWGEHGYIRIARQEGTGDGICGIAREAYFPYQQLMNLYIKSSY